MGRQRQICFLKLEKDDFFLKSRCPRYTELKFYEFLTYLESTSAEQLVLQGHYRTYPDCSQLSWLHITRSRPWWDGPLHRHGSQRNLTSAQSHFQLTRIQKQPHTKITLGKDDERLPPALNTTEQISPNINIMKL